MKIIITGATGFIGRNLAESFKEDGFEVIASGRSPDIGAELQKKGIIFIPADLLNSHQLNNAFSPVDCVIHCAAKAGDWGKYKEFYNANVIGTRHVLEACKKHNIAKLIFISTPSIYYTGKDRFDISENEPLPAKMTTHYSKTKLMAEADIMAHQQDGFKFIIFRPRAVYGRYDNIIVPRILKFSEQKNLPLINNGQAMVDITYIDNFVEAVKKALSAPNSAWNEIYNVSNGNPITIKDWFSQVLKVFDRPFKPKNIPESTAKTLAIFMELVGSLPFLNLKPAMTRFSVGYIAKSMTMNINKAKEKLQYFPPIANRESFEKFAQWYHSQ